MVRGRSLLILRFVGQRSSSQVLKIDQKLDTCFVSARYLKNEMSDLNESWYTGIVHPYVRNSAFAPSVRYWFFNFIYSMTAHGNKRIRNIHFDCKLKGVSNSWDAPTKTCQSKLINTCHYILQIQVFYCFIEYWKLFLYMILNLTCISFWKKNVKESLHMSCLVSLVDAIKL
jgi:hypothetical protein